MEICKALFCFRFRHVSFQGAAKEGAWLFLSHGFPTAEQLLRGCQAKARPQWPSPLMNRHVHLQQVPGTPVLQMDATKCS